MVFKKNLTDCHEFTANDGCRLRELLHPKNDPVNLSYSIAVATVAIRQCTDKHTLKQTEVYYILTGSGQMHINEETESVNPGDVILIPPGAVQWLENTGVTEIQFIAIVSPPWTADGDTRIDNFT